MWSDPKAVAEGVCNTKHNLFGILYPISVSIVSVLRQYCVSICQHLYTDI